MHYARKGITVKINFVIYLFCVFCVVVSTMSDYSVGSGAGTVSSQIRCSREPCGNFTTRPLALEPWTAHASCSKHTKCTRSRTCEICSCWPETTWFGFDNWMPCRKQRSQRDAANRARKAKARARERSESLRRAPLLLSPPRAPLRWAPLRRGSLSQRSPRPLLRSPLLLWNRLMVL